MQKTNKLTYLKTTSIYIQNFLEEFRASIENRSVLNVAHDTALQNVLPDTRLFMSLWGDSVTYIYDSPFIQFFVKIYRVLYETNTINHFSHFNQNVTRIISCRDKFRCLVLHRSVKQPICITRTLSPASRTMGQNSCSA